MITADKMRIVIFEKIFQGIAGDKRDRNFEKVCELPHSHTWPRSVLGVPSLPAISEVDNLRRIASDSVC